MLDLICDVAGVLQQNAVKVHGSLRADSFSVRSCARAACVNRGCRLGTFQHWAGCYSRHSSWQTASMQLLTARTTAEQNTSHKVLYWTADGAHLTTTAWFIDWEIKCLDKVLYVLNSTIKQACEVIDHTSVRVLETKRYGIEREPPRSCSVAIIHILHAFN